MLATISLLSSLLTLALNSPLLPRQANSTFLNPFALLFDLSGSNYIFSAINATGGTFWIGKATTTYCPLTNQTLCPSGKQTLFVASAGDLALYVTVPGGQEIYVAPSGALSYTQPHSTFAPSGSAFRPFILTPSTGAGFLDFTGLGSIGWLACPAAASGGPPWQVFADIEGLSDKDVPAGCKDECLAFPALALGPLPGEDPGLAWEYV